MRTRVRGTDVEARVCDVVLYARIFACVGGLEYTKAPSWLDSLVGRAMHRHRRGHGFESRQFKPEFFQAFFSQLLELCSNCEDLSSI